MKEMREYLEGMYILSRIYALSNPLILNLEVYSSSRYTYSKNIMIDVII